MNSQSPSESEKNLICPGSLKGGDSTAAELLLPLGSESPLHWWATLVKMDKGKNTVKSQTEADGYVTAGMEFDEDESSKRAGSSAKRKLKWTSKEELHTVRVQVVRDSYQRKGQRNSRIGTEFPCKWLF